MIDPKGKEVPVTLEFDKTGLAVKALKTSIAEVPYANISKLSYEVASEIESKVVEIV